MKTKTTFCSTLLRLTAACLTLIAASALCFNLVIPCRADILVTDGPAGTVQRYDETTGKFLGTLISGQSYPLGIAFGAGGKLYIAQYNAGQISRFLADGTPDGAFAYVPDCVGLDIDSAGNVYVGYQNGDASLIYRFLPDGTPNGSLGSGFLHDPQQIRLGPDGYLYAANWRSGDVVRLDTSGATGSVLFSPGQNPFGLAFSATADLYATSAGGGFIDRWNATSGVGLFASGLPPEPSGLCFDRNGNLLVADFTTLRRFHPDGTEDTTFLASDPAQAHLSYGEFAVLTPALTSVAVPATKGYIEKKGTLKATLKSGGSPIAGKWIQFAVDGNPVGSASTNTLGMAMLAFTPSESLSLGIHTLTAQFVGDAQYSPATGHNTLTVYQGPVKLAVANVSGASGATVTLKASLKNYSNLALAGRSLDFTVNGISAGTAMTNASGVATLSYTIPAGTPTGTQPILVQFAGDTLYLAGSKTGTLTIK